MKKYILLRVNSKMAGLWSLEKSLKARGYLKLHMFTFPI